MNNKNVFDTLKERGLIAQTTHEDEIRELLGKEKITFYIGFDPTADSLHIGHFMQLIVMKHMQNAGHRPIVLLGGGTTMVGDPTGKADMRPMITQEVIQHNADNFKKQMSKFINFDEIELDEAGKPNLDKVIKGLKETSPYLFKQEEQAAQPKIFAGGNPAASQNGLTKEDFKRMGINERQELFDKDPELYQQLKG